MMPIQFPSKRIGEDVPIPASHFSTGAAEEDPSAADVMELSGELRAELMPKHIGVILDGNGRWATSRGEEVWYGHRAGMIALRNMVENCCEFGVKVLTVYAFSTENWKRSEVEVDFLMKCFEDFIYIHAMDLIKRHKIRFSAIGDTSKLPKSLRSAIQCAEEASHANQGLHFLSALNYSGRHEITEACKKIAAQVRDGALRLDDVDETTLDGLMMTNFTAFPNPDLIIRTSGELRVSNFMLWQLAYSEFYFPTVPFPNFGRPHLVDAISSFQRRDRRYGERRRK